MKQQMKFSISWHQKCLENSRLSLADKEETLAWMQAEVEQHRADAAAYERQIEDAVNRGTAALERANAADTSTPKTAAAFNVRRYGNKLVDMNTGEKIEWPK